MAISSLPPVSLENPLHRKFLSLIVNSFIGFNLNCCAIPEPMMTAFSFCVSKYEPFSIAHALNAFISSGRMPMTGIELFFMAVLSVRYGTAVSPFYSRNLFTTSKGIASGN